MTTVTDSDIKDIKDAIATLVKQGTDLAKQMADNEKNLTQKINDVEKNLTQKINDVEKNLTQKINDVEKNLEQVSGEVKATNAKIDGLDKRVTTQEFIYRAVFISIITLVTGSILTTVGTSAIRFFWDNPLFHP